MRESKVTLDGEPSSVPAARHFVSKVLASSGADDEVWVAAQVTTELATNAVVHAATAFVVRVDVDEDYVRIAVTDRKPLATAARRHFSVDSTTGRGLRLVASLSTSWGVETSDTTKTVWCEITRSILTDDPSGSDDSAVSRLVGDTLRHESAAEPRHGIWGRVA
jgi:anti-sigma regulatory factor (Ser/Thr protein kinase)